MKNIFRIELRKAFDNPRFLAAVSVASAIAVLSAVTAIMPYMREQQIRIQINLASPDNYMNPDLPMYTLFSRWIGQTYNNMAASLFYLLLPAFAVYAYSWSYFDERQNGYVRNVIVRIGRWRYFFPKYIVTFISGAVTVMIPMVLNLLLVSSVLPAIRPDVYYDIYNGMCSGNMGVEIYYEHPWVFVLLRLGMAGICGGLCAVLVLTLSFFIHNRFEVLLIPFILLLVIQYFSEMFQTYIAEIEVSPLSFIHGGMAQNRAEIALAYAVIFFVLSFAATLWRGGKDDVF